MARSPDRGTDNPGIERVIVNIDGLEELSAIRESLNQIRECIDWWLKNNRRNEWLPMQDITTMPDDCPTSPATEQTAKAVTDYERQMPPLQHPAPTALHAEGVDDETQFCCAAPDLQWTGNPHFPGVACMNCGYIVADCGSVVMELSPEADPDPEPKEHQRGLFMEE